MKILVLGGDGHLGWPTALHLSEAGRRGDRVRLLHSTGHQVAVADNFARRSYDFEMGRAGEHHYNVVHSGLVELGLEPRLPSDTLIESLFEITKRHAHRARPEAMIPTGEWRKPSSVIST
jgi:hypothetical protein